MPKKIIVLATIVVPTAAVLIAIKSRKNALMADRFVAHATAEEPSTPLSPDEAAALAPDEVAPKEQAVPQGSSDTPNNQDQEEPIEGTNPEHQD